MVQFDKCSKVLKLKTPQKYELGWHWELWQDILKNWAGTSKQELVGIYPPLTATSQGDITMAGVIEQVPDSVNCVLGKVLKLQTYHVWFYFLHLKLINNNCSERSACAARVALQTGCVENEVASINSVISLSLSLCTYFSPRWGWPRVVKNSLCHLLNLLFSHL